MAKAKAKNYLLKTITIESVPEIGLNLTVVPVVPEVALIDCDSVIFPSLLREKKHTEILASVTSISSW